MGKLIQFQINLNQNLYYAGQWVLGEVIVNLTEGMKMRGIQLEFYGRANVHWTERHSHGTGKNRRTETRHYRANETYFSTKVILYGNSGGMFSDSTVHPAGIYKYPVQFQLPGHLPSSFEGQYGRVRYYARCVIDRPWKFDHSTKQPFTVISQLDLNQMPQARTAPQGQDSKTLCCWCCASGPIEVVVRLDRTGYVPGENILVNAEVTNNTNRKLDSTKAQLIQKTTFYATSKSRTVTSVIAQSRRGVVEAGQSETWSAEPIHIPPVPPSELAGCNIIDIKYLLKFVADPSGPAFDLEVPLGVIIGTIPLQSYFNDYSAAAASAGYAMNNAASQPPLMPNYADPSAPPMPFNPTAPPPPAPGAPPGAPPPSYQESVFGKVDTKNDEGDNEHTMGQTDYAPMYPYYNWNATAYSLPEQPPQKE